MKQLTNQQIISALNNLISKIDQKYTEQIDNPKTPIKRIGKLEMQSTKMTSEIQNVINYISLYN